MANSTRRKPKSQSKVAKKRPSQYAKDKTPAEKKKRAERNRARNAAIKKGTAKKGDGKDVGHKKPLAKGGAKKDSNTKVQSRKSNRAEGGKMGKGKTKKKAEQNASYNALVYFNVLS